MWKYIKFFKWHSIFVKYLAVILLVIIIPFTLFAISSYKLLNVTLTNETTKVGVSSLVKCASDVENIFKNIDIAHNVIAKNLSVFEYLNYKHTLMEPMEIANMVKEISDILGIFILSSDYIYSIDLYHIENNTFFSISGSGPYTQMSDDSILDRFQETGHGNYVTRRQITIGAPAYAYEVITACKEIKYNNLMRGILIVNLDAKKLRDIVFDKQQDSRVVIVDERRMILFDSEVPSTINKIDDMPVMASVYEKTTIGNKPIFNGNNLYSFKMERLGYTVIKSIRMLDFKNEINFLKNLGVFIVLFMVILIFIISAFVSLYFYKKLLRIIFTFQLDNDIPIQKDKDEINYIIKMLSEKISDNEVLEKELAFRLEMLNKSQMIALQSQINPHFIINALQIANVITLSEFKRDNEATMVLSGLSELLRAVFQTDEYLVKFHTEVHYVKKYLEIQNIRYHNKYHLKLDIAPESENCQFIKLSLQPLIENAIIHGINPLEKPGTIHIASKISEKHLIVTVQDNGCGMEKKRLREVENLIKSTYVREGVHLGLCNVYQRIKLIFGENGDMYITSSNDGTTVTLKIPI